MIKMDEREYRLLVDDTLARIDAAYADVDPDLVECTISQGALTLLFKDGTKAIVSPQPPVRQMWLAFRDRAWHFDRQGDDWVDAKGGVGLYRQLEAITQTAAGEVVQI